MNIVSEPNIFTKKRAFLAPKALVGVLHLDLGNKKVMTSSEIDLISKKLKTEAELLQDHGFSAILIACKNHGIIERGAGSPEIIAGMTAVVLAVKNHIKCSFGVQYLNGGNRETLAIAIATGAQFIRAQAYHTVSTAATLMNYRKNIEGDGVALIAEIFAGDAIQQATIIDEIQGAVSYGADGIILSNYPSDKLIDTEIIRQVYSAKIAPLWIGSGVSSENLMGLWSFGDAFVIDAFIRQENLTTNPMDLSKLSRLKQVIHHLKHSLA